MPRNVRLGMLLTCIVVFALAVYVYGWVFAPERFYNMIHFVSGWVILLLGSGLLIVEVRFLRKRNGWSSVWYWQALLVLLGAVVAEILGSLFTRSSGPAGGTGVPITIAFGIYGATLLLGPVWTRVLGVLIFAWSIFHVRDLRQEQRLWEQQLLHSVQERDAREGLHH